MAEKIQSLDKYHIERITESDLEKLSVFSCGVSRIDNFFKYELELCYKYRYVTPYKCYDSNTGEIVAAFTLSNDIISLPEEEIKDICAVIPEYATIFKQQSLYPAINIGHLAVRLDLQRRGIGQKIVEFVRISYSIHRPAGCQFLTVDALNTDGNRTVWFYQRKLGFTCLSENDRYKTTRRMYLPLFELTMPLDYLS